MKKRRRGSMLPPWWITVLFFVVVFGPCFAKPVFADTDCSQYRAWPEGPHLSEKNAGIVDLFFGTWGDDACQQWADEHRASAATGLRALGYIVLEPVTIVEESVERIVLTGRGEQSEWVNLTDGKWWLRIQHSAVGDWRARETVVAVRNSDGSWQELGSGGFVDTWPVFTASEIDGPTLVWVGSDHSWTVTFQRVAESDYINGPDYPPVAPWDAARS